MKVFSATLLAIIIVGVTAVRSDDPLPAKANRIKAVKPIVLAPQPKYRVTVQSKPKFAPENRPAASQPAVEKGLSVTIQPERTKFAGNGPLAFEVVLKNVSEKTFLLYG
ncbi:MAG: hypothetical protein IH987_20825, partial [Planctomycetes bacterium]|nr:hypothetical protein [Planctomycetota bacterium]